VPDGIDEIGTVVQLPPPGDAWYGFPLVEFPGGKRNIPATALIPVTGPGVAVEEKPVERGRAGGARGAPRTQRLVLRV
jgi:hypothetical protein